MHRPMTPTSIRGCAALLGVAALCAMIAPAPARADTVTDWNGYASTAIVATAGQPPPAAVLSFAMVQGAVYDAVNAIDRGHRPYLPQPPAGPSDSKDAAAATAAYHVLVALFPPQQPTLQPLYDTSLAAVADTPPGAKAGGIAAGEAAAAAMLAARAERRPLRPVHARDRHDAGRLAPDTAALRARPGPLGRQRPAVRGPERRDAAHRRPQPADEPRLRQRLQRDQGRRRAAQHDPHRRIRPTRRSSGRTTPSRSGTACSAPSPPTGISTSPTAHGCSRPRTWPPPTPRSAAGTTSTTGTPGARSPPSARPRATATGPPRPTRPGRRCSTRPRRSPRRPRSSPRRSPSTPQATTAPPARSWDAAVLLRHRPGRVQRVQQQVRDHAHLPPPLRRPKENINARVWAGIHFRTADLQGASSARRSPATSTTTTSNPPTDRSYIPTSGV